MTDHPAPERRPVVLCVLDGWGLSDATEANAVALARTPTMDRLVALCPHATLEASGEAVGLPAGQIGNSEVGHTTIGAGRVIWMDLPRIDRAIADGDFARRPALRDFVARTRAAGGVVHLLGLMSPGGVHAHQSHIAHAARVLAAEGLGVRLHLFLDGRDTPPKSALGYLDAFEAEVAGAPGVSVASVSGRFYALDRDHRWERVALAHAAIARAQGPRAASARAAIEAAYARGETDEFVAPTVIGEGAPITAADGLFMANFRADRVRELLAALLEPGFDAFDTVGAARPAAALGMAEYSDALDRLMPAVFTQEPILDTLGAWVAARGATQLRLAETEKYPHVTFFLNGGAETALPGESRVMAPSPKVATYDLAPEMSAAEVGRALVAAIDGRAHDLIVVNFANPDMVGHTGVLAAAIRAVETVDAELGRAAAAIERVGGAMLVIADHGNCEVMRDPISGEPHTAHTLNPVPVVLLDRRPGAPRRGLRSGGGLADVAPTVLALMGVEQPSAMTGRSLLVDAGA